MTDADQGGEWVTGFTGEEIHLDAQGNPIIEPPSDGPTELPDPDVVRKALDDVMDGLDAGGSTHGDGQGGWLDGLGDLKPTGIFPGGSGQIGGNDDETQKEIWRELDSGQFGGGGAGGDAGGDAGGGAGESAGGSIPPDVETAF